MPDLPPIVLVPGLGADAGIYDGQRRFFGDRLHVTQWIDPLSRTETIDSYGRRLAEQLSDAPGLEPPYWVGGISFGGMVAAEVAEARGEDVLGLLLIGSCTERSQVSAPCRLACAAGQYVPRGLAKACLNHLVPQTVGLTEKLPPRGVETMHDIWFRADTDLMKWAANGIRQWEPGAAQRVPTYRAHGRKDLIIPIRENLMTPGHDLVVPDGRHLIHLTHERVINTWMDRRIRRHL